MNAPQLIYYALFLLGLFLLLVNHGEVEEDSVFNHFFCRLLMILLFWWGGFFDKIFWPQIAWTTMVCVLSARYLINHSGKVKYNFYISLPLSILEVVFLYYGGFFKFV